MGKKHKKHHKAENTDKAIQEDKPLKLVLKVGAGSQDSPDPPPPEQHEGDRKHKHKKKKKKKKSEHDKHKTPGETSDRHHRHKDKNQDKKEKKRKLEPETVEIMPPELREPLAKKALFEDGFGHRGTPSHERRPQMDEQDPGNLQRALLYIHKMMARKDVNGFFAAPVTDSIAPGYSSIIAHPMDLSTMKDKIEHFLYGDINDYKKDFKLMCDNCMTYNRPETVFYKEARRLLNILSKTLSKEKLLQMKKTLPVVMPLTNEEMCLDEEEIIQPLEPTAAEEAFFVSNVAAIKPKPNKGKPSKFEAIPDDLTADEILAQAQEAARQAKENLTFRQPNSKIGFLRRRDDGTTTLKFLNPDNDGIVGEKERVITLGELSGKLHSGTGNIAGFKEDKRNKATPVSYLNYGPYASYAPTYDSSFATLTKEDSDMILATYGDETGIQYARSLQTFVADSGEFASKMVDRLLDLLTDGEHSKTQNYINQKKEEEHKKPKEDPTKVKDEPADEMSEDRSDNINSIRSLSDQGIDTSFLNTFEQDGQEKTEEQKEIDKALKETSTLIKRLQKMQHDRLSHKPPMHLAHVSKPSEKEQEIANQITKALSELAHKANPGNVASVKAIRNAMGMTLGPVESDQSDATSQPDLNQLQDPLGLNQGEPHTQESTQGDLEADLQEFFNPASNSMEVTV